MSDITEAIKNSPTVAASIPAATTAIGVMTAQSFLTLVSMLVGIAVSLVLLSNHLIKRRILIKQERILDEKVAAELLQAKENRDDD